jgi:hypothetical protein
MQSLFYGAHLKTCDQIGMAPQRPELAVGDDRGLLTRWAANYGTDPDMFQDLRIMVPVFYDTQRRKMKVWAVLGLVTKPLRISFSKPPIVKKVVNARRRPVDLNKVTPLFKSNDEELVQLVTAELYVNKLLNRQEFRVLCDHHKTEKAILDKLQGAKKTPKKDPKKTPKKNPK